MNLKAKILVVLALATIALGIAAYWGGRFPGLYRLGQGNQSHQGNPSPLSASGATPSAPGGAAAPGITPPNLSGTGAAPARPKRDPQAVAAFIAMAKDVSISADDREARIMAEGKKGALAEDNLMALGDADTYFSAAAIRSLGQISTPEVQGYLERKLNDSNPRVVSAAVQALAQMQGTASVGAISNTLASNRTRSDGFEDLVSATCVEALGNLKSPAALPILSEELSTTVGGSLGYDYGSKVLKAVEKIGDPSAVPFLEAYVGKLSAKMQETSNNPKAQGYLQLRIEETQATIRRLKSQ